jgi:hypothetical protein
MSVVAVRFGVGDVSGGDVGEPQPVGKGVLVAASHLVVAGNDADDGGFAVQPCAEHGVLHGVAPHPREITGAGTAASPCLMQGVRMVLFSGGPG